MDGSPRIKSSTLTSVNNTLKSQSEIQQHLLSHYKRIAGTKARVDLKPPHAFEHSISWKSQHNKWGRNLHQSSQSVSPITNWISSKKNLDYQQRSRQNTQKSQKCVLGRSHKDKEDLSVAHKITWYLEAIQNNSFHTVHGVDQRHTKKISQEHKQSYAPVNSFPNRKALKKDKKIRHKQKPIARREHSPELRRNEAKHLNYNEMLEVPHYQTWLQEQAVMAKIRKNQIFSQGTTSGSDSGRETERSSPAINMKIRNESDRINFLSQVTEDILNMGLFTNRAIKKAIEFHMEHNKDIIDKDELHELSNYLMESLNVTADEKSANTEYKVYHAQRTLI